MSETSDRFQKPVSRSNERIFRNPITILLRRIRCAHEPLYTGLAQSSLYENLQPFTLEPGRDIDQLYKELKQLEERPADMDEVIRIVGIDPSLSEFNQLQSAGMESSFLQVGCVTRGALLDAGYVFLNRIGGGEKPLISAQLSIDVEGNIETVDMGKKVLLTQTDLDAVIQYQKSQPGVYITESADIDSIRKDMLLLLQQSIGEQNNLSQNTNAVFRVAQRRILDDSKYTDKDRDALKQFFIKEYEEYQKTEISRLGYIMQECMIGIDIARVRGIPFEIFAKRLSALQGAPSPFLDSGFHFNTNYDVTFYPHDSSRTRRLNMGVIHLLSRGLNEMGESTNQSHDQRYFTAGEYEKEIYEKNGTIEPVSDEDLEKIATRLLVRAK